MLKPIKDLISFKWIPPKVGKIIMAEDVFQYDKCKVGKYYVGDVEDIGPLVKNIKIGDHLLVHEFSPKNKDLPWKEDKLYYVNESEIQATLDKSFTGFIHRIFSSQQEERLLQED